MTFLALLVKELRSRLRRERTIWLMVIYVLILGATGAATIQITNLSYSVYSGVNVYSQIGTSLYYILSILELFLIIFIVPAFTATSVNGEKERQTYDLLLCSQLSGVSLVAAKLVAGLVNALLLIASSIPLFSLLFFFGGVSPSSLLAVMVIYVATAILVGSGSLLCSIIISRPAISTALAYVISLFWLSSPVVIYAVWMFINARYGNPSATKLAYLFSWNPVAAIIALTPSVASVLVLDLGNNVKMPLWLGYTIISLVVSLIFFVISAEVARPGLMKRLFYRSERVKAPEPASETVAA
jgi:ABC-type transport system involved in multi-copper enzyme maturation permease subunit